MRGLNGRNDTDLEHSFLVVWVYYLGVLYPKPTFSLTFAMRGSRAHCIKGRTHGVNCKTIGQVADGMDVDLVASFGPLNCEFCQRRGIDKEGAAGGWMV